MPLVPLKLPPGISRTGTPYQSKGRWRDCNFIRWAEGVMRPVGGWRRITETPLTGRVGGMLPFRDNDERLHLAIGTSSHCYAITEGSLVDLTPAGFTAGTDVTAPGLGFGAAEYNAEAYGTERTGTTGLTFQATSWHFDTWGRFLVASSIGDGRIYYWDPGSISEAADTELQLIANAPTDNLGVVVTEERHMMALAADGDPRLIRWSSREDFNDWTPTATNTAGDLQLQTQGTIRTAFKSASRILVLTDVDVFVVDYVGVPFAYGSTKVANNAGIISPRAGAATTDFVVWMGFDGFFLYDGRVRMVDTEVWDWVFRELNVFQRSLVTCGRSADFPEVWWFFPVNSDTFNSRYVVWNYKENTWTIGRLQRTHWQEKGVWGNTLAAGTDNHVYEHDIPLTEAGLVARSAPYAESAPFDMDNGGQVVYVNQLIPDKDSLQPDALQYEFKLQANPKVDEVSKGPYYPDADGYTDVRFGARQVKLRVTAVTDVDWRLGVLRAEIIRGGRR